MSTRRKFIVLLPLSGSLLAACGDKAASPPPAVPAAPPAPAPAEAPKPEPAVAAAAEAPMVDPKDPTAASLGYVAEAAQADAARFPKYAAGQACNNCALFGGKPGDATGPCPLYTGKRVNAGAWCSGYTKKAG
jgi:hypothetical protein